VLVLNAPCVVRSAFTDQLYLLAWLCQSSASGRVWAVAVASHTTVRCCAGHGLLGAAPDVVAGEDGVRARCEGRMPVQLSEPERLYMAALGLLEVAGACCADVSFIPA
jgi:hypothetical protein